MHVVKLTLHHFVVPFGREFGGWQVWLGLSKSESRHELFKSTCESNKIEADL